jgi:succinate dehydrogenase hydrophobic anchor subunit
MSTYRVGDARTPNPFFKVAFGVMLIDLLLHVILSQHQIILEGMKNVNMKVVRVFVHLLNLREAW